MKTRIAKHRTLALAVAACVAGLPAWAGAAAGEPDGSSKPADVGAVAGLAIGAAAGGPVGAVVGAAAGVVLGDRYHRQKQTTAALKSDLGKSEAERTRLSTAVVQLNATVAQSQARGEQLSRSLAALDEVGMDVSFRTDDASIKAGDLPPLLKLGALVVAMPDVNVRIAGFADPRGAAAYNEALSRRRADVVAAALMSAGVPSERLIVEAHGSSESTSAAGDLDAYALDRRVTVRLERTASPSPASQAIASSAAGLHEPASRE